MENVRRFIRTLQIGGYILEALPAAWQLEHGDYRRVQARRLQRIVGHAYRNVALYRRKYDQAGVKPQDIRTLEDLQKLPIISRQDLVESFPEGILARNVRPGQYRMVATTGSTGAPLRGSTRIGPCWIVPAW